jgi:hypothetical protein
METETAQSEEKSEHEHEGKRDLARASATRLPEETGS